MMMNGNGHMMPDGSVMAGPPMNGANGAGEVMPPYVPPSRTDIIDLVNTHERDMEPLRRRMVDDYDRYRLVSHVNRDNVTGEALPNYAVYTSNRWKVFADKVISWQNLAELMLRVRHMDPGQHPEEADNMKERFAIGNIRAAEERLRRFKEPSLRGSQAFFGTVRGGYIGGRSLLVNRPDGTCYADITAWDPMHIHWGVGQDGLAWGAYKIKKTREQIRAEYGVEVGGRGFSIPLFRPKSRGSSSTDAERSGIWTYDYYDGVINTFMTDSEVLKKPTPHGSPRVPVYLELVGSTPLLQSEGASNLIADVGESVFAPAREIGDKINSLMSIFLEIVERARGQTVIMESPDGKKTLPDDPFKTRTDIATRTGDRIYTLELQKMAVETMAFMTLIDAEWQRATLPHSSYGETPFQLSGFAITQLRQATETVLASRIGALEGVYSQITELLYDQFMTGAYDGMTLSGVDSSRNYFNQQVRPEMLQGSCDFSIELVSQLPQDDMAKWSQADIAKKTELLSDDDIRSDVLGIQDAQQASDKMRDQKAAQGLPEAQLYTLGQAAAKRGDMVLSQMYLMAFDRLMAQQYGLMPVPGGTQPGQPGQNGANGAKPKGQEAEVMSDAARGAAPQPETSNNGTALVPPGTPRPGARGQSA